MHFSTLLATVRVALTEVVLAFLLHEGSTICNASDQFRLLCFLFLCRLCFSSIPTDKNPKVLALYVPTTNSCISTSIENWTHVYMNLFTQNSPYYHLLKYLLFLLKHSVYIYIYIHLVVCLTTGPKPLPKRAVHIVRSRASSFK